MLAHLVEDQRRRSNFSLPFDFQPKGYYTTVSYPHPLYPVDKSIRYKVVMEMLSNMQFWRLIKVKDSPLTYLSIPYYRVTFSDAPDFSEVL